MRKNQKNTNLFLFCSLILLDFSHINRNMGKYCQNCGHDCHCGENCMKKYDSDKEIVCCTHCRHEETTKKPTIPEDLFNGA